METLLERIRRHALACLVLAAIFGLSSVHAIGAGPGRLPTLPEDELDLRFAEEDDNDDILVWDGKLDREVLRLKGHTAEVFDAKFSPDRKTVASGGEDQTVRIWDATTGKQKALLEGHAGAVEELAFSPDASRLASIDETGRVIVWDLKTNTVLRKGETEGANDLQFSPNGRILALVDGHGRLWNLDRDEEIGLLDEMDEEANVSVASFSPDSQSIACISDEHISIFETATRGLRCRIHLPQEAHVQTFEAIFSPDGRHLATSTLTEPKKRRASSRILVKVWSLATGEEKLSFERKNDDHEVAFSPDGKQLLDLVDGKKSEATDLPPEIAGLGEPRRLEAEELASAWTRLGSVDALAGYTAMHAMVDAHPQAIAMLKSKFSPGPAPVIDPARVKQWIRDLDSDTFETRERAAESLAKARPTADELLRQTLAGNPSAEARRRLKGLLEAGNTAGALDLKRAVQVLEMIGSADAGELLAAITKDHADPQLREEAGLATSRLDARREKKE